MSTLPNELKTLARRLVDIRTEIVKNMPFYGRLLMHLQFGFADCETAFTDQKKIVFDPKFADRLDDKQLEFIMFHELYHCVLNHCTRSKGKRQIVYNIACDIVVNSLILEMLSINEMDIDGCPAMHIAPDGKEGRKYTADEIYSMLVKYTDEELEEKYGFTIDTHLVWSELELDSRSKEVWRHNIKESAECCTIDGVPFGMQRLVNEMSHHPKCNWRQLLCDLIQYDRSDYSYIIPDKRFCNSEFVMPSYQENIDGACVRKLWAAIDTSGSVTRKGLTDAMNELYGALTQVNLSGWVSFFDCEVTEPVLFEDADDLDKMTPIGGGGTSFDAIFDSIKTYFSEELPEIIVVLTDGFAMFPDEEKAMGIPVIWVIIDSDVDAPWGKNVHVTTV